MHYNPNVQQYVRSMSWVHPNHGATARFPNLHNSPTGKQHSLNVLGNSSAPCTLKQKYVWMSLIFFCIICQFINADCSISHQVVHSQCEEMGIEPRKCPAAKITADDLLRPASVCRMLGACPEECKNADLGEEGNLNLCSPSGLHSHYMEETAITESLYKSIGFLCRLQQRLQEN